METGKEEGDKSERDRDGKKTQIENPELEGVTTNCIRVMNKQRNVGILSKEGRDTDRVLRTAQGGAHS